MKLSIFRSVLAHPSGKEQKSKEASKATTPETVVINNENELIHIITTYSWSPFVFLSSRSASEFISTDLLVYDIDEGMTIDEAEALIDSTGLCCLCLPSTSHTPEAHRFRLVLPLSRTITDPSVYQATWKKGAELFKVVDDQCKDLARLYFGSKSNDGFWADGKLFDPVEIGSNKPQVRDVRETLVEISDDIREAIKQIYGKDRNTIPEIVDYFLKNAHTGLPGHWINTLNSFAFSLGLSGVSDDTIWAVCEQYAPAELDKRDIYQIKKAIVDAKNYIDSQEDF
jgi:hypothetical protein